MDTYMIDAELEHYLGERLSSSSRQALCRLHVRACARFHGAELEEYRRRLRAHARAYARLGRMLQSPFRHMETALFLSSFTLFVAGIVMVVNGDLSALVACGTAAGLVGMIECARKLAGHWHRYGVMEAVYRELDEQLANGC
ncbi:GSU0071 family protein [Geobacter sulfurreducens]|uniref:GSU0071 family protein n=1 Tax=Geobacter sulfurreducens TaxID=35554 RepID=UPI000DBB5B7F|nr:hypothetical protein [Geobacter sulfurreducens]BBA71211.1 hypothetical protein YM18_2695 [Geobacter sulfurreducens]